MIHHAPLLKRASTCALILCLLALTGCASVQVKMGWKVYLDRTPVKSIEASLPH